MVEAEKKEKRVRTVFPSEKRKAERKAGSNHVVKATSHRNKLVHDVVREVSGFAPYEKRVLELLKIGTAAANKRALKFSKKRLGSHSRGKGKREEMVKVIQAQRRHH